LIRMGDWVGAFEVGVVVGADDGGDVSGLHSPHNARQR
jgi:hypothetical protein